MRIGYGAQREALAETQALYSMGAAVADMRAPFLAFPGTMRMAFAAAAEDPGYFRAEYAGGIDRYARALALGCLLRIPAGDMAVLRDQIDFFGYRDAAF